MTIADWSSLDSFRHEPWAESPAILRFLRILNGDLRWDEPDRHRTRRVETNDRRAFYADYLEVE
jgi:hypothetical protein